jgi:hypothetical protein
MKFLKGGSGGHNWQSSSPDSSIFCTLRADNSLLTHQFVVVGCCPEYSVSFPPRFTHGSMGCRTCFLPIFSEAAFFLDFFPLGTSPSRELKSSGMESPAPKIPKNNVFFYCGSGNTPFVACVVTVAWGFIPGIRG